MQILKFKGVDEAIHRANDTSYGLVASVFTKDIEKALHVAQSVRAGSIWVNCYYVLDASMPFGGYKDSGVGREMGEYGLQNYTEVKMVSSAASLIYSLIHLYLSSHSGNDKSASEEQLKRLSVAFINNNDFLYSFLLFYITICSFGTRLYILVILVGIPFLSLIIMFYTACPRSTIKCRKFL